MSLAPRLLTVLAATTIIASAASAHPNWNAIDADCEVCDQWYRTNWPKEGTPERKAAEEAAALFIKYYGTHSDQIYSANMGLAK